MMQQNVLNVSLIEKMDQRNNVKKKVIIVTFQIKEQKTRNMNANLVTILAGHVMDLILTIVQNVLMIGTEKKKQQMVVQPVLQNQVTTKNQQTLQLHHVIITVKLVLDQDMTNVQNVMLIRTLKNQMKLKVLPKKVNVKLNQDITMTQKKKLVYHVIDHVVNVLMELKEVVLNVDGNPTLK